MDLKPKGWYLGLPYMDGPGLTANKPDPLPENLKGAPFIFSGEVLLQSPNWREVLGQWWFSIKDGGNIILWIPDCRLNDVQGAKITREDILQTYSLIKGWECLEDDMIDGHHFSVFKKTGDQQVYKPWRKSEKHCLVMRPGALGDAIMASSIFPGLNEQGFDIDFYCHHNAVDAVRNDPHLKRVLSTEANQTPDGELPAFWKAWSSRYDRVVNLTNSVEGALLAQHWRSEFYWPDDQRRRMFTGSYLKSTHDIAGVPGPYRVHFFETDEERKWAEDKANELGPFVLWCLRGSAVHKWYPFAQQAICQILAKNKDIKIVLSADEGARPLEDVILRSANDFLGETDRLKSLVGTGSVRRPMALAKLAKVVVGPETGVLNAVSFDPVNKVCLLSHSAASNLTDDWLSVTAIKPNVSCYPCHRLHHSHDHCPQDPDTTAAMCAASITPATLSSAVLNYL